MVMIVQVPTLQIEIVCVRCLTSTPSVFKYKQI